MTQANIKQSQYLRKFILVLIVLLGLISIITSGGSELEFYFGDGDDRIYPTVTTLPATDILPHSAVLQGMFNPNGVETTANFRWGGDPSLVDNIDAWGVGGTGTSTISYSAEIDQLSSDTTYYFMSYAYTVEYAGASGTVLNFKTPYTVEPYWARTYGGNDTEYPDMISLTSDGGYLVTGSTYSIITGEADIQPNDELWIIKLDSEGKVVWQKQYRELPSFADGGAGHQLSNGEFVVATNYFQRIDYLISSNPWFIKLGADGSILWQKIFDKGHVRTVIDDGNDNMLVAGSHRDAEGKQDYWLMKLNSSGEVMWQKSYGADVTDDLISTVVKTVNGYMMTGSMDGRSWLLEVDELGNVLWQKLYSCTDPIDLPINAVVYDPSQGYMLLGKIGLSAKIGLDGSVQWVKKYSSVYGSVYGNSVINSGDGGYVFGGRIGYKNGLIKIDESGNIIWSKVYGPRNGTISSVRLDMNNDIVFASGYEKSYDDYDIQVAKLPADGTLPPVSTDIILTPEDMECSFQEDTFVSARTTSSVTSSTSASVLNTFATVLQQAP